MNEEDYLERCLISLKNQEGYDNFEIIVVDGGSSDDTVKIAKKYANKIIISQEKSPSIQRNLGAKIAMGDILAFIDADTVASKFWLKGIVKTFQDQSITGVTGPLLPLEKIKRLYLYNLANTLQKILVKIHYPVFWGASCAFRTNAFWKIEGFDEKLLTSEDHDISLRIKKIGKAVFNDNILAFTSHRRFLESERSAFSLYMKDIVEYFFLRKIRTFSMRFKIKK
ncbi:MAG: glycosyltransferase [Candidatus Bathyarchaeota archaeon]|nr:MAG: glycosyltransferase [Candidatus Bathyarchaeota archaeon]